jgi:hypothetical protein
MPSLIGELVQPAHRPVEPVRWLPGQLVHQDGRRRQARQQADRVGQRLWPGGRSGGVPRVAFRARVLSDGGDLPALGPHDVRHDTAQALG